MEPKREPKRRLLTRSLEAKPGPVSEGLCEVRLTKGRDRWIFKFEVLHATKAVQAVRSVLRRDIGLDWVDVALITHEIRLSTRTIP